MPVIVEEGLHPNGADLVVPEAPYQQHTGVVDVEVDGIPVKVGLRLVSSDGKLFMLRSVVVMHPDGSRLRQLDPSQFVDDQEYARG